MIAELTWPDVEHRGVVQLRLNRSNLESLLRGLDARSFGETGLVSVDGEMVVVVTAREDADH